MTYSINSICKLKGEGIENYYLMWEEDFGLGLNNIDFNIHRCKTRRSKIGKYNLYLIVSVLHCMQRGSACLTCFALMCIDLRAVKVPHQFRT